VKSLSCLELAPQGDRRPVMPLLCKEIHGSLKFPGYPFEYMPRTQTPVVSESLALALSGLLPSDVLKSSAFIPHIAWDYPSSTTIHISGLKLAACILDPSGSILPLPGLHAEFSTDLPAQLWSGGIYTHWVTVSNFNEQLISR
jgi:hypothetical protein